MIGILGSGPPLQLAAPAGLTIKVDETVVPDEAVIVTIVGVDTLPVGTGNPELVCPARIVTEDRTGTTAGLLLESETTMPPAGAGPTAVTMPLEPFPLMTASGPKTIDESAIAAGVTVTMADPDLVESAVLIAFTVAVVALAGAV